MHENYEVRRSEAMKFKGYGWNSIWEAWRRFDSLGRRSLTTYLVFTRTSRKPTQCVRIYIYIYIYYIMGCNIKKVTITSSIDYLERKKKDFYKFLFFFFWIQYLKQFLLFIYYTLLHNIYIFPCIMWICSYKSWISKLKDTHNDDMSISPSILWWDVIST